MGWKRVVPAALGGWLIVALCGLAARAEPVADPAGDARMLLFSGIDLWTNGGFSHGGILWASEGLDRSGPVFKLVVGGGVYRYRSGPTTFVGRQFLGSALPGWRFSRDHFTVDLYGGLDMQEHRTYPTDPSNRLIGTRYGARAGGSVWWQPFEHVMATAAFSVSSIGRGYWTRGAVGLRVLDQAWIGPEALALGDDTYRQFRVGVHVTGWRVGAVEWSASGGFVRDSDRRSGPYGALNVLLRR